jgi:Spy/CpxP family protein refolding chaperone
MKRFLLTICLIALVFASLLNADGVWAQSGRIPKNNGQKLQPQSEGPIFRPRTQKLPPRMRPRPLPSGDPRVLGGNPANLRVAALQKQRKQMLMEALNLTPDQQVRVRDFARSHDDESAMIGRRLRQSRNALDRALMSETYNEALIKRLTEEFVAAQAEQVRLNTRIRAEFRSVLTPEQVRRFVEREREIQQRIRELKQQELLNQQDNRPPDKDKDGLDEEEDEMILLDLIR